MSVSADQLAQPGRHFGPLPPSSVYNGMLTAPGYGSVPVVVTSISYGLNIVSQEDHAANRKAFYARMTLTDTFTMQVQFLTSPERRRFYRWALGYAAAAVSPSPVGLVQATCQGNDWLPAFSMVGVLASGVVETTTPSDVTWPMTLGFMGAQFTADASYVVAPDSQTVMLPPGSEASRYFYPTSSLLASTSPDALYAQEQSYSSPAPAGNPPGPSNAPAPPPPVGRGHFV